MKYISCKFVYFFVHNVFKYIETNITALYNKQP